MKLILLVLVTTFLQASILPINLGLLFLISRSFLVTDKANLWVAFSFGLMLSFLTGQPLGLLSILYLVIVFLIRLTKSAAFSSHWLFVFPLTFLVLCGVELVLKLITGSTINFYLIGFEVLIQIPVYILVAFWEDRFVYKTDIRLKYK